MRIFINVPAYNEEKTIAQAMERLAGLKEKLRASGHEVFIVVINDGSTDNTGQVLKELSVDHLLEHPSNQGLGSAVRTGLQFCRAQKADIAIKIDADLQHEPSDVLKIIEPIVEGTADIVYGNRFEKIDYKMPLIRRWGNAVFTGLIRWLTKWPVKDGQPGLFAVNHVYLSVCYLPGDYNYTQQILLDGYHKGMRFTTRPVHFHKREKGSSFVTLAYPLRVLPQLLLVLVSIRPMRIFLPVGISLLALSLTLFFSEIYLWMERYTTKPVMHVNLVGGLFMFGMQIILFGLLAEVVVRFRR